jgi:uncharacterized protein YdgA (DUF945 family)
MQRSALSVLALAALLLGLLPLWGGCEAQRTFEALDAPVTGGLPGEVEIETNFARGWLRSRAETRLRGAGGEEVLHHTLTHGPLPLAELLAGRAPWPPVRALIDTAWWPQSADTEVEEPWLEARTRVQLDDALQISVESAPRSGEGLVWGGLEASLVSPQPELAQGLLWAPQLELAVEGGRIALRDVAAELELIVEEGGIPLGSAVLSIGLLSGAGPLGEFGIEEARWELRAEDDPATGTCSFEWSAAVERVSSDAERYGPGEVRLVARRLDRDALSALIGAARAGATPDAAALQDLLAGSPELELDPFEMKGPDGALRARARLGIDGGDPRVAMGPVFAALAVEASAEIRLPVRWLHRMLDQVVSIQMQGVGAASAQQQVEIAALRSAWIRDLVSAGWLLRQGEAYRLALDYRGGQLLLNGRPLDPAAMASLQHIAY